MDTAAEPIAVTDWPNEALEEISQLLQALFLHQEQIDLSDNPDALRQINEAVPLLRERLQEKGRAAVHLENLVGSRSLHTVLYSSQIEAWLALRNNRPHFEKHPPTRCPGCDMPLGNTWNCLACGLELESPYQQIKINSASQTPTRHLPYHHVLLTDSERRRLLFVNCRNNHQVVWEINAEQWSLQSPRNALYCGNHRILLCDDRLDRVLECGLLGETLWEFDTRRSPQHALKAPARVTRRQHAGEDYFLIADTGHHRVLMVDRQHQIHWQYGVMGQPGSGDGLLNHPTDVQMTASGQVLIVDSGNRRVIEVNPDTNQILWRSPEALELAQPLFAERLFNQHMIIVDGGRHRILELNAEGLAEEEVIYFNAQMDPVFRIDQPLQYLRRENQNILIGNGHRVMEIDPIHKHALWVSGWNSLNDTHRDNLLHTLDANPEFIALIDRQDTPPLEQWTINQSLRRIQIFQDAPEELLAALPAYLTHHSFPVGQKIVIQGTAGDSLYLLRKGQVQVIREPDILLATLESGDIFGEMALVLSEPRTATVKAVTPCEVMRLSRLAFETAIQPFPEVYRRLQELSNQRAALTHLKTSRHLSADEASVMLQGLLDAQQTRLQKLKAEFVHRPQALIAFRPAWRLLYSKLDQYAIHAAILKGRRCFEIHLHNRNGDTISRSEVCQVLELLKSHGELLKILPVTEAIIAGHLDHTLALTLATRYSQEQILTDLSTIEELAPAQCFEITF